MITKSIERVHRPKLNFDAAMSPTETLEQAYQLVKELELPLAQNSALAVILKYLKIAAYHAYMEEKPSEYEAYRRAWDKAGLLDLELTVFKHVQQDDSGNYHVGLHVYLKYQTNKAFVYVLGGVK